MHAMDVRARGTYAFARAKPKIPIGKLDVKGFSKKILQKVPRFLEKIYYMYILK